jgi:hypothetical protein
MQLECTWKLTKEAPWKSWLGVELLALITDGEKDVSTLPNRE